MYTHSDEHSVEEICYEQEYIRNVLEVMDCSNIVNVLTEERMDKNEY